MLKNTVQIEKHMAGKPSVICKFLRGKFFTRTHFRLTYKINHLSLRTHTLQLKHYTPIIRNTPRIITV